MKHYLTANEYLHDSWYLAEKVFASGWRPDVIVALWRGGAPVGVAVHEYLAFRGWKLSHAVMKCFSYSGIGEHSGEVKFECAEELLSSFKPGEKVLVVDDVFDTGKTAEAMKCALDERKVSFRFATVYWKRKVEGEGLRPDYCVREVGDDWLVFPHEIVGLSDAEVAEKDPFLGRLTRGAEF